MICPEAEDFAEKHEDLYTKRVCDAYLLVPNGTKSGANVSQTLLLLQRKIKTKQTAFWEL